MSDGGEGVRQEGAANHRRGAESVGGKLSLTATRLAFVPHPANFNRAPFSRPIDQIRTVDTFGVLRNGLSIHFADGTVEQFYVYHRRVWIESIQAVMTK